MRTLLFAVVLGSVAACAPSPLVEDHSVPLPDSKHAPPGTGFTVTGIAVAADGTIWAGNDGRHLEGDDSLFRPSLVHLTADGAQIIEERQIRENSTLQGVMIDGVCILAALPAAKAIVRSCPGGVPHVAFRTTFEPNGLARAFGRLIATDDKAVRDVVTGKILFPLPFTPDHLAAIGDHLWITGGPSRKPGILALMDRDGKITERFTLKNARAIEGIAYRGRQIVLANDGYYHRAGGPNELLFLRVSEGSKIRLPPAVRNESHQNGHQSVTLGVP